MKSPTLRLQNQRSQSFRSGSSDLPPRGRAPRGPGKTPASTGSRWSGVISSRVRTTKDVAGDMRRQDQLHPMAIAETLPLCFVRGPRRERRHCLRHRIGGNDRRSAGASRMPVSPRIPGARGAEFMPASARVRRQLFRTPRYQRMKDAGWRRLTAGEFGALHTTLHNCVMQSTAIRHR